MFVFALFVELHVGLSHFLPVRRIPVEFVCRFVAQIQILLKSGLFIPSDSDELRVWLTHLFLVADPDSGIELFVASIGRLAASSCEYTDCILESVSESSALKQSVEDRSSKTEVESVAIEGEADIATVFVVIIVVMIHFARTKMSPKQTKIAIHSTLKSSLNWPSLFELLNCLL